MCKKIEVGTPRMREIFEAGVELYQPTLGGHELPYNESGVTDFSYQNIKEVARTVGENPLEIEFGPNMTVFFRFPGFECYTATGFGWGYGGSGPSWLAKAANLFGFAQVEDPAITMEQAMDGIYGERLLKDSLMRWPEKKYGVWLTKIKNPAPHPIRRWPIS
jgi:hypothetical protein